MSLGIGVVKVKRGGQRVSHTQHAMAAEHRWALPMAASTGLQREDGRARESPTGEYEDMERM